MTPYQPLVRFLIGGVQKCGTTALATYLSRHPKVILPARKEAHVFDSPSYDESWPAERIDEHFGPLFEQVPGDHLLVGDATPNTIFHPGAIARVAKYNPGMKWILLFRDPVQRAVSHHAMSRNRGHEHLPLWAAVLAEPFRLHGWLDSPSADWSLRKHSYISRGRYARQVDELKEHFPASQILLLKSEELLQEPTRVLAHVCSFLEIGPIPGTESFGPVFRGDYTRPGRYALSNIVLHLALALEASRLARRHGLRL
jgi:hypothetical protein